MKKQLAVRVSPDICTADDSGMEQEQTPSGREAFGEEGTAGNCRGHPVGCTHPIQDQAEDECLNRALRDLSKGLRQAVRPCREQAIVALLIQRGLSHESKGNLRCAHHPASQQTGGTGQ